MERTAASCASCCRCSRRRPDFRLTVTGSGLRRPAGCYPPQQRDIAVSLAGFGGNGSAAAGGRAVGRPGGSPSVDGRARGPRPAASGGEDRPRRAALRSDRLWR